VAVAGLIWYWQTTYGSERAGRWVAVGALVALAALMRWQLVTFALLPAGECLTHCRRQRSPWKPAGLLALAALAAVVCFLPQVVAWHAVYGDWLAKPVTTSGNWLWPSWGQVLASTDRSLFYWTPLPLLALAGFFGRAGRRPEGTAVDEAGPSRILLAAFLLQVYLMASLWGEEVQLGVSFGFRHLTESLAALAPGLALLLERAPRRRFLALGGLLCLLVLWNLLLIGQYRYGLVPAAAGAPPETLLANALRLIARKKLLLIGQVLLGPFLLWLLVRRSAGPALPAAPAGGL
jgi:hypothetical protein